MRPQDSKIEHTETEPNEPDRGGKDGDETVQIKGDRGRGGGRGGMVMSLMRRLCRIEAINVHEAPYSGHSEQTGDHYWEDLTGL